MVPCDNSLFPKNKIRMKVTRCEDISEIETADLNEVPMQKQKESFEIFITSSERFFAGNSVYFKI